jgi:hypothetical protein
MHEYTTQALAVARAPQVQTPEPPPRPQTLETYTLSGLQFLGLVMTQNTCPAEPTRREAKAAGNTLDVDVE